MIRHQLGRSHKRNRVYLTYVEFEVTPRIAHDYCSAMRDKEMINRYIEYLINQSEAKDLQNRSLQLKIDELTDKITSLLEEKQKEGNRMEDLLSELKELRKNLAKARSEASSYIKARRAVEASKVREVLTYFHGEADLKALMSDGYNAYMFLNGELEKTDHLICRTHAKVKFSKACEHGGDDAGLGIIRQAVHHKEKMFAPLRQRWKSRDVNYVSQYLPHVDTVRQVSLGILRRLLQM